MNNPWTFGWDQLFSLVTAGAVAAGAVAAWVGLRTWRQEQIERRQCELAEEALALMYEAQEVFASIRHPASYGGEGSSRIQGENETPEEKQARDLAFVPIERINSFGDFFGRVVSVRPRFRAMFGKDADGPLAEILGIRGQIVLAVRMLRRLEGRDVPDDPQKAEEHHQRIQKNEAIKWSDEDNDEIEATLAQASKRMEKFVGPILRSRYRHKVRK
jgi:hypothetical protein